MRSITHAPNPFLHACGLSLLSYASRNVRNGIGIFGIFEQEVLSTLAPEGCYVLCRYPSRTRVTGSVQPALDPHHQAGKHSITG